MWAVQALAVNVGVQLRLFPEFADPADELELDQQETQAAFLADWGALLSPSQREAIGELDAQLESMGGSDNTHLWSVEALASAPEWAQVRARAARVLREMGWRLETPPMNRATYITDAQASAEAFRASRIVWMFRTRGGSGRIVMPFDELGPEARAGIVAAAGLAADEVPAVAGDFGDRWVLLTTRRLLHTGPTGLQATNLASIETIGHENPEGKLEKGELHMLRVTETTGESVIVDLEPGAAFFGFWNALRAAWRLARAA